MADTWFSLHCTGVEEPIYVSEVIEKAMNPSFRFFDLNIYGPLITRLDELTIKYWARTENMEGYVLLVDLQLCFRSLQFIGKSVRPYTPSRLPLLTALNSLKASTIRSLRIAYSSIFRTEYTQALQTFR